MLKSLFSGAFKSPFKLLAVCLVLYVATTSILVSLFLVIAAFHYVKNNAKKAPRSSERDTTDSRDVEETAQHANRDQGATAHSSAKAAQAPQRQYAKSAVVIPMKAPSNQTTANSLKTGTK
ncbi:hypothetical protein [Burkholderia mayonis]|uniref:Uncharacterized protein n=1 Tax=Burkholderia mayonis TaxID=1385591 RepID=A0A1B4G2G7_9BURK|nr:hypothetical protein [Burkholderia mayonis]AOJ10093.1 hypothetical protein WS71_22900 [Burkholderia mayonis]KVE51480.1 hypothetical protein WS71_12430 [Burkholderia mayonis]